MKKFDFTVNCKESNSNPSSTLEDRRERTINNVYQNYIFTAKTKRIADEIVTQNLTSEEIEAICVLTQKIIKFNYIKARELEIENIILDSVKTGEIVTAVKIRDVLQEWFVTTPEPYSQNVATLVRVQEVLNKLVKAEIFKSVIVYIDGQRRNGYKRIG